VFDEILRRLKDEVLAPLSRALGPLDPNLVSWLAFAVGLGCAWAAGAQRYRLALGLWFLNRLLDGLDGSLARVHGRQSDYGGYLDLVLDFAVYALIPLGIVAGQPVIENWWALALLLGAFLVNAPSWMVLSTILEQRRAAPDARLTTVAMPPGLVAGTETLVFFALFLLFPSKVALLFTLMAIGVFGNVIWRLVWARRALRP
jgi:phosphatidylglycerophosphate synthase